MNTANPRWEIQAIFNHLVFGNRSWGTARLCLTAIGLAFYLMFAGFIFEGDVLVTIAARWQHQNIILHSIPNPLVQLLAIFFTWRCLRYLLAPLAGLFSAFLLASRFHQDVFNLMSWKLSAKYLIATLFGIGYPHLEIKDGKRVITNGDANLLDKVGGPGYILIRPGNAILVERLRSPANVRPAETYFAERFESIKEIASLDDQHGSIESMQVTTKDGIEVTVRDIAFRYRLRTGARPGDYAERTPSNPYPYSTEAIRNMAYQRAVDANGLTRWEIAVSGIVRGTISDYIQRHEIDMLTAPGNTVRNPRIDIRNLLHARGVRQRLRRIGTELLWVDIGHIDIAMPEVDDHRLQVWQSKSIGDAKVEKAFIEANLHIYRQLGRAEAQAQILYNILPALQELPANGNHAQYLRQIILARTASILENLGEKRKATQPPQNETKSP